MRDFEQLVARPTRVPVRSHVLPVGEVVLRRAQTLGRERIDYREKVV